MPGGLQTYPCDPPKHIQEYGYGGIGTAIFFAGLWIMMGQSSQWSLSWWQHGAYLVATFVLGWGMAAQRIAVDPEVQRQASCRFAQWYIATFVIAVPFFLFCALLYWTVVLITL